MSSIISAGTTLGTSLSLTGDTSGELQIQTNNGATTALTLTTGGAAVFTAGTVSDPAITTTGDTNTGIFFPAADTIAFTEGGVEAMRITSTGRLGIGTDNPSNLLSVFGADVEIGNGSNNGKTTIGSFVGTSSQTDIKSGGFTTFTTFSGGSFGERMRIDSSGNVGIGTTSNLGSSKLDVRGRIRIGSGNSSGDAELIWSNYASATTAWTASVRQDVGGANNDLKFLRFDSSGAYQGIAMQIDSASGNVGIGTSSPAGKLTVSASGGAGVSIAQSNENFYAASLHRFFDLSYANERMRIDSSGNLLVGTTAVTGSEKVGILTSGNTALRVANNNASFADTLQFNVASRAASSAYNFLYCAADGVGQVAIRGDGVIFAQNTTVQSISDVRTKENIVDSQEGIETINALRPVRFDFKEGFGNNRKNQLGFIAQEIEQVFPDAVDTWGESDDPENPYKSVGTTALIPVLVKAIQEQQALIKNLTTRLNALEGK